MDDSYFIWDQHCCLPLLTGADVGNLSRYARGGGSFASVNVGFAPHSYLEVLALIESFSRAIERDPRLYLVANAEELDVSIASRQVAVAFDLEDSGPLEGEIGRVETLYGLGVRTMLTSYNNRNAAGSGCLDAVDEGLTAHGRDLVREMNAVGMVVDGSHCSARSGLEMADITVSPMVYSHSCMQGVWSHPRNVTDDQGRAHV